MILPDRCPTCGQTPMIRSGEWSFGVKVSCPCRDVFGESGAIACANWNGICRKLVVEMPLANQLMRYIKYRGLDSQAVMESLWDAGMFEDCPGPASVPNVDCQVAVNWLLRQEARKPK